MRHDIIHTRTHARTQYIIPLEAHVVQLDETDLERVDAEDDASVGGEEMVRRSRPARFRAHADTVLQGVAAPVVLFLRGVGEARKIYCVLVERSGEWGGGEEEEKGEVR